MKLHQLGKRFAKGLGLENEITRNLNTFDPFPQNLVVHVTYHKCLTLYYSRIMQRLAAEFPFILKAYYGKNHTFQHDAHSRQGKRVLCLTDRDDIAWETLPDYRGSHFIRDPRDLIVSGYHYHLWTNEEWCQTPDFPWKAYHGRPHFELVEPDPARHPQGISYQTYLKSLDPERGMVLEMVFRQRTFEQMGRWNYDNPNVLEQRYEEVIGNEPETFEQLFEHYRFHRRLRARGIELAKKFRLENQSKRKESHLRSGKTAQWKSELPVHVRDVFKMAHGALLIQLGYERDLNW